MARTFRALGIEAPGNCRPSRSFLTRYVCQPVRRRLAFTMAIGDDTEAMIKNYMIEQNRPHK